MKLLFLFVALLGICVGARLHKRAETLESCTIYQDSTFLGEDGTTGDTFGIDFKLKVQPGTKLRKEILVSYGVPHAEDDNKCKFLWDASVDKGHGKTASAYTHQNFYFGLDSDDDTKYYCRVLFNKAFDGGIGMIGCGLAPGLQQDVTLPMTLELGNGVIYEVHRVDTGYTITNTKGCGHVTAYEYFTERAFDIVGRVFYKERGESVDITDMCNGEEAAA